MTTIAVLCLLLLERFMASDMDVFTEPVLVGLRAVEKSALRYTQSKLFAKFILSAVVLFYYC